jgi:hydrogenase large subunit
MSIQTQAAPGAGATGHAARNLRIDPVTRVSGSLAVHASADFGSRTVADAVAMATTFRGYENVLEGRDARDAIFISSRACGVCGGAHAIAAAQAVEMACDISLPAKAIIARNFLAATECMSDHPSHLFLRAGPDYSEPVVRATSPELWTLAEKTLAAGADTHTYTRISDIMRALTRSNGPLYREALHMSRIAREAYVLIGGKYPHPQTITPGGVSSTVDATDFNLALMRVVRFFDYSRRVVAVWDDLASFFYEADPRYAQVGAGPMNFLDMGLWDDPFVFDGGSADYERRWSTPAAIVGGVLQTTSVEQIDKGTEEHVAHSFYGEWGNEGVVDDFPQRHPHNKRTIPQPGNSDPAGRYSWSTAARWNGHPMETGAQARMWATALAAKQPHTSFIEPTGNGLRMTVPQGQMAPATLEWQVPNVWNAFERNRARAYAFVQAALVAYENIVVGLDVERKGGPDRSIFNEYVIPKDHVFGSGHWGGGRGAVSHHVRLDGRVIQNHQILGPSTFSGSPRDGAGTPGPCEASIMATPLVSSDAAQTGIDVLRAIRSFDLCMFCATH